MNKYRWDRALHGTGARALRHYRAGETPLRQYCPACANAAMQARALRNSTRDGWPITITTPNDNRGTAAA